VDDDDLELLAKWARSGTVDNTTWQSFVVRS
jgi:hypothetical protein